MAIPLPARFAFYGTLRRGGVGLERLGVSDAVRWLGPCVIPGALYRVSWYPALIAGPGRVTGDLFLVHDTVTVATLDAFEGSEYDRIEVRLATPDEDAWVYTWNGATTGLTPLGTGDWLAGA